MVALPREFRTPPWTNRNGRFSALKALALVLLVVPGVWTYYDATTVSVWLDPRPALVYWWGVWAILLLLATLFMTPCRRIFRWSKALAIRRMIGVGALVYTLAHTIAYVALRMYDAGLIMVELSTRISITIATVSLVGLLVLGLTSFDAAIKWMGSRDWTILHNGTYVFTGMAVLHFLLSPGSVLGLPFLMAGIYVWLMGWRLAERRGLGDRLDVIAGLSLLATVFTVVLEMAWSTYFFEADPITTLGYNFTLELGITAGHQMLGLGALVTAGAALRRPLGSWQRAA